MAMKIGNEATPQSVVEKLSEISRGLRALTEDDNRQLPFKTTRAIHVYEGEATVCGVAINGSVVYKISDETAWVNALISLPDGGDMLIPNAQFKGCFIRIGTSRGTILITEEVHDGLLLHFATGKSVAVAMHAANVPAVTRAICASLPQHKVIICARGDSTELDIAASAAHKINALVATPEPEMSFLALFNSAGADGVVKAIEDATPAKNCGYPSHIEFDEVTPWPRTVNGQSLITDIHNFVDRHISLSRENTLVIALYVLFTYTVSGANIAPILAIYSFVKLSGKKELLSVLARLVYDPLLSLNLPPLAEMFVEVPTARRTLLIGNAQNFLPKSAELTALINSGFSRSTAIVHRTAKRRELREFSTFGSRIIAMLGLPPESVLDRSIPIKMQPKLWSETKAKMDETSRVETAALVGRIKRFTFDNRTRIKRATFAPLDVNNDRLSDTWSPLLAIASVIGDEFLQRTRDAANSVGGYELTDSVGPVALLRDFKVICDEMTDTRITTDSLLGKLCHDAEAPWQTASRGKPLTSRDFAKAMRVFGIASKSFRTGEMHDGTGPQKVLRGYELEDFQDAFARYLH